MSLRVGKEVQEMLQGGDFALSKHVTFLPYSKEVDHNAIRAVATRYAVPCASRVLSSSIAAVARDTCWTFKQNFCRARSPA